MNNKPMVFPIKFYWNLKVSFLKTINSKKRFSITLHLISVLI